MVLAKEYEHQAFTDAFLTAPKGDNGTRHVNWRLLSGYAAELA